MPNKAANLSSFAFCNYNNSVLILHANMLLTQNKLKKMNGMSYVCPYASTLVSTSALGPVGCWEPRMFAPAGEGAYPAVPPLPVPASERKLQAAL